MNGSRRHLNHYVGSLWVLTVVLAWLLPFSLVAAPGEPASKKVELTPAEFTMKILQVTPARVTWSESAFAGTNTNLVIAILGPDPFNGLLQKLVADFPVGGRTIVVKTGVEAQAIPECHVLFVPENQQSGWLQWRKLNDAAATGVLTIGEHADFLDTGGIVKVLPTKRQFEVHVGNARRNGLHLDPKFVRVASNVIR